MPRDSIDAAQRILTAMTLVGMLAGCGSSGEKAPAVANPASKVNPAKLQAIARAPTPPGNAANVTSVGKGTLTVSTANSPTDTDVSWVVNIDLDGDGDTEQTTLVWDDDDGVLYAYAETEVACELGGTASISLLVAVNAADNPRHRPPGSGFYAEYFDAMECNAQAAGIYGARFDAKGKIIESGALVIDAASDEVILVARAGGK